MKKNNELISISELSDANIKTELNFSDLVDITVNHRLKEIHAEAERLNKQYEFILNAFDYNFNKAKEDYVRSTPEFKNLSKEKNVTLGKPFINTYSTHAKGDNLTILKLTEGNTRNSSFNSVTTFKNKQHKVFLTMLFKVNNIECSCPLRDVLLDIDIPEELQELIEVHNEKVREFIVNTPESLSHTSLARKIKIEFNTQLLKSSSSTVFIKKLNKQLGINI